MPKFATMGSTVWNVAAGHDSISASVPSVAPLIPPETGQSTHCLPAGASPAATSRAVVGPVVETSSMIVARPPWTTPSSPKATALTMGGVGRLVSTMSAASATLSASPQTAHRR